MAVFVETVENSKLKNTLRKAIQKKKPFSRFKQVLEWKEFNEERKRWFQFSEKREEQRAVKWILSQGLRFEDQ